jgi:hypothetical protein
MRLPEVFRQSFGILWGEPSCSSRLKKLRLPAAEQQARGAFRRIG